MKILALTITCVATLTVCAQPNKEVQAVKSLCGCYEVDFKYAETFAADTAYKFSPRYHASGLEWVVAEETSDKKIVIQHLLLAGDSLIIKHWREDWEFEKNDWWQFNHDASWTHVAGDKQSAKGKWTQSVWEVDDAPRYQGTGNWVSSNGKYYWENTTDAPLPRREYTKRSDYNVMQRTNRIIITDTGWVHEQDNKKIIRKDGKGDVFLAEEKGYNVYRKTDDAKCKQADAWWQKHRQFWKPVRESWEMAMKGKSNFQLISKVDGQFAYQQLDALEEQAINGPQLKEKVAEIINKHSRSVVGSREDASLVR